jgi:hypothetical protein
MKVYKVELLIIDHDGLGAEQITDILENNHYPNHCMYPDVKKIIERDIGEWNDDHPLNSHITADAEYRRVFEEA